MGELGSLSSGLAGGEAVGQVGRQELDGEGRRRCGFRTHPVAGLAQQQSSRVTTWHLLRELQECPVWILRESRVMSNEATKVLTTYLEDCHSVYAPCAYDGCDWKYGAWGEDVYVQRCLDRHYVDKVEAFDMTLDGACEADRPADQKKNKKWHAEDCSQVTTAAVPPFKKPADYFKCLSQMTKVNYA